MTGLSANGETASFPCYVYDLDSNSCDAAGSSSEPSAGLAGIESYPRTTSSASMSPNTSSGSPRPECSPRGSPIADYSNTLSVTHPGASASTAMWRL